MIPSSWLQFTWDLAALPVQATDLPDHYQITPATREDEKELRKVITSSFALDPNWNPAMQEVMQTIDAWLEQAGDAETSVPLALRHGVRIIGAAVVSKDPAAENHLLPGPCILMEYRNRGFGTCMLERSLALLREAGLSQACAIGKENSLVTKFLYTKFNSTQSPHQLTTEVAA